MNNEQMKILQKQFKEYLENKYMMHTEATYDTKKSDAFYPLRHPNVGMEYNDVYSSKENLEHYYELFESYWIYEKKKSPKSIGAYKKAFKDFFDFIHEDINFEVSETKTTRTISMISRVNRNIRLAEI